MPKDKVIACINADARSVFAALCSADAGVAAKTRMTTGKDPH